MKALVDFPEFREELQMGDYHRHFLEVEVGSRLRMFLSTLMLRETGLQMRAKMARI
jgi:hypothetical protein